MTCGLTSINAEGRQACWGWSYGTWRIAPCVKSPRRTLCAQLWARARPVHPIPRRLTSRPKSSAAEGLAAVSPVQAGALTVLIPGGDNRAGISTCPATLMTWKTHWSSWILMSAHPNRSRKSSSKNTIVSIPMRPCYSPASMVLPCPSARSGAGSMAGAPTPNLRSSACSAQRRKATNTGLAKMTGSPVSMTSRTTVHWAKTHKRL